MPSKKRKHKRNVERGKANRTNLRKQILSNGISVLRRGKSSRVD